MNSTNVLNYRGDRIIDTLTALVPFLKTENGKPFIQASQCGSCGHKFVGEREVCAQCASRTDMRSTRLAETGKLYAYTIVERSYPGVKTPFIDVVVDMDDGAHLKGTLTDVEPSLENLVFDMPLKIVYREVVPALQDVVDGQDSQSYLSYCFVPA